MKIKNQTAFMSQFVKVSDSDSGLNFYKKNLNEICGPVF